MSPERWSRVKEVFEAVADLAADERSFRLEATCGGDGELRNEVERLLAERGGSSLRSPVADLIGQDEVDLAPGDVVGHYRIESLLGKGGMGVVYRACDLRLRREAALKVLSRGHASDPPGQHPLMKEARAVSALNHPNIVTVYDAGSENGVDYIAMEYVAGRALAEALPPRGLPWKLAVEYAIEIASALAAAHSAGVVHGDLKPSNIMLADSARIKVLDFGLSRRIRLTKAETATVSMKGEIAGTPAYMAPERVEGKPSDVRSDIFAFGATLYEMLSGRRAFVGSSTVAVLGAVLHVEPPPLKGVPACIAKLVNQCLCKNPERRLQHMEEVKRALEKARQSRRMFWFGRMAWMGAVAIVLLAALLVGWHSGNWREVASVPPPSAAHRVARRTAVAESVRRPEPGIFRRRHDRGSHRRCLQDSLAAGNFENVGDAVQGSEEGASHDCERTACGFGFGRFGAEIR